MSFFAEKEFRISSQCKHTASCYPSRRKSGVTSANVFAIVTDGKRSPRVRVQGVGKGETGWERGTETPGALESQRHGDREGRT